MENRRFKKGYQSSYLFLNHSGKRMSTNAVRYFIKKVMKLSDINREKNITPHSFRRSFSTHCNDLGYDIMLIRDLMGHADIKTTQRYITSTSL